MQGRESEKGEVQERDSETNPNTRWGAFGAARICWAHGPSPFRPVVGKLPSHAPSYSFRSGLPWKVPLAMPQAIPATLARQISDLDPKTGSKIRQIVLISGPNFP